MRELPTGTVTLLFTDIEGSTRLLEELGDRYADVLAEHRRLLREAFRAHGGVEVDTQGDAFFYAFTTAGGAVEAARNAQLALADGPVRVRIGIHTGEPIVGAEGYVGIDVHRAARIMGAGHGGQVLVSERTRSLLDGVALRDLGLHRLKDLSEPQPLYQLGDGEFPPLRTLHATNLPTQATPLIGRERELAEALHLLRSNRLLTLTGPGGSGKTRLALQLAAEALEEFPHGVFWVPLQALRDPELVLPTIAETIGSKDGVAEHVGDKRLLLLLDNLEQVIGAAPALADLLADTRNAKLLVTSREALRIAGEQRYDVEPLPQGDAVTLFIERARAVAPTFEPDPAVAAICSRLDGLPLAIELAAARVNLLSSDELLARLERTLPVLTAGARDAPERQRTLRATIEWSYDLLDDSEQRLFRRLAVFAASFDIGAVEPVCEGALDTLQSLVDKSIVRRWATGRFGMLETVYEYAEERLEESREAKEFRRRHAEYFLSVAKSTNLSSLAEGEARYELAATEHENFRRALEWALDTGDVGVGLQTAVELEHFWVVRPFEGMRWLAALLERADDVPLVLRAHALRVYGGVTFIVGEFESGDRLSEESLLAYRACGDERGVAEMLNRRAMSAVGQNDLDEARARVEQALAIHRRLRNRRGEAVSLGTLGTIEWRAGNRERSLELMGTSAALAAEAGFTWWQTGMLYDLCERSVEVGRWEEAERFGWEALDLAHRIGDRLHAVYLLALLARIAGETGRLEKAGLLWGALEQEEERGPVGQWEAEREAYAAPVLARTGGEFQRGRERGRRLSFDEAIKEARG